MYTYSSTPNRYHWWWKRRSSRKLELRKKRKEKRREINKEGWANGRKIGVQRKFYYVYIWCVYCIKHYVSSKAHILYIIIKYILYILNEIRPLLSISVVVSHSIYNIDILFSTMDERTSPIQSTKEKANDNNNNMLVVYLIHDIIIILDKKYDTTQ